eukprot:GILJ01003108.1.p1 GENE.GILJ01003108.1~~GILJ01003108.1.p1  ORF type:complete len:128 (+),score=25.50 GILJ01003108.1:146-529(+)
MDAAIAVSGTVVVELAAMQIPTVATYKARWIDTFIYRVLAKVPFASIPNIMADQQLIPERLADQCNPTAIATAVSHLLESKSTKTHLEELRPFIRSLLPSSAENPDVIFRPSYMAAKSILKSINIQV